jgi:hypothetical protein
MKVILNNVWISDHYRKTFRFWSPNNKITGQRIIASGLSITPKFSLIKKEEYSTRKSLFNNFFFILEHLLIPKVSACAI